MYAVISDGSKQYKVSEGDQVMVERLDEDSPAVKAVMLVDGDKIITSKSELENVQVKVSIVSEAKGDKIQGFNYKNKSNQRKRYGHRQKYHLISIDQISD